MLFISAGRGNERGHGMWDTYAKPEGSCEWYLLCKEEATTLEAHPVLGDVPICDRCKAKNERLKGN